MQNQFKLKMKFIYLIQLVFFSGNVKTYLSPLFSSLYFVSPLCSFYCTHSGFINTDFSFLSPPPPPQQKKRDGQLLYSTLHVCSPSPSLLSHQHIRWPHSANTPWVVSQLITSFESTSNMRCIHTSCHAKFKPYLTAHNSAILFVVVLICN